MNKIISKQVTHICKAVEEAGHTDTTTGKKTTTETPVSGKGTGEEASLGASGSSGDEWSGTED